MSNYIIMPNDLISLCTKAMRKAGFKLGDASIAAEILVSADMRGINSHGTIALSTYLKQVKNGGVNPRAELEIISQGQSKVIVDGNAQMGVLSAYKATMLTIEKAKNSGGIAIVGVRNGMHFGAASYYSRMIAKEDMIGIAMSNAAITTAVTGASGRVIGNNPFSYAAPAGKEKPAVFDIGMSVAAGGKINLAKDEGKRIPKGWLIDKNGNDTTDPWDFSREGALLIFGGHKGYGFALLVEILAGVMTGAAITKDIGYWYRDLDKPCNVGHTFIALNIGLFISIKDYKTRMDSLIRQIRNSPKAKGVKRIYLPGEIEHEREEWSKTNGIILSKSMFKSLRGLAEDFGLEDEFNKSLSN